MINIPLKNSLLFAIVDDEDRELVSGYDWLLHEGYAKAGHRTVMHKLVCPPKDGLEIDHVNGNRLDNRRCNLRYATSQQNKANRRTRRGKSGYKGVDQINGGRWRAVIRLDYSSNHLGTYDTPEEAARAYDAAARFYHGEFALTNFEGTEKKSVEQIRDEWKENNRYSKTDGVTYHKNNKGWTKCWQAKIDGKYLGCYLTEEEAAEAVKKYSERKS